MFLKLFVYKKEQNTPKKLLKKEMYGLIKMLVKKQIKLNMCSGFGGAFSIITSLMICCPKFFPRFMAGQNLSHNTI